MHESCHVCMQIKVNRRINAHWHKGPGGLPGNAQRTSATVRQHSHRSMGLCIHPVTKSKLRVENVPKTLLFVFFNFAFPWSVLAVINGDFQRARAFVPRLCSGAYA